MLYYRKMGTGPPVILVHGLLGSCATMGMLARGLARKFEVLVVDLRNHGSSFHAATMTYKEMARDLVRFMDEKKLVSACVAGHSMGGKCAMQLAMDFPDRVNRLAVLDMAPRVYEPLWKPYIRAMLDLDLSQITRRDQAGQLLEGTIPDRDLRTFFLQNLRTSGNNTFFWRSNLAAIQAFQDEICARISGSPYPKETLFIRGGESDFIRDTDWNEIKNLFPKAMLKTIAGAGHLVHMEHKDLVTELLDTFFMVKG
jgi:esterase